MPCMLIAQWALLIAALSPGRILKGDLMRKIENIFLFNRANKGSLTTEKLNIIIEENRWVKQMYMLWVTERTTDVQNKMTSQENPPLQFLAI